MGSGFASLGVKNVKHSIAVFGKAQGYTMKPALQIDRTNARLLVEALSGRWSYEQDRRDKRTVWHYVANAFSLCVDRIDPGAPPPGPPLTVNTYFNPTAPYDSRRR